MKTIYQLHVDVIRDLSEYNERAGCVAIHRAVNELAMRNRWPEISLLIDDLNSSDTPKMLLAFCMATVNFPVNRQTLIKLTRDACQEEYPEEVEEIMRGLE